MSSIALTVGFALVFWLASQCVAFAFGPPVTGAPFTSYSCERCHSGTSTGGTGDWTSSGPHGGYTTTTSKCGVCHKVHNAPATGIILLAGPTVSASCLTCHDGTQSGIGPYHSIAKHGGTVREEHSTDSTKIIPGGSSNLALNLSCSDCHSVHAANVVTAFVRDSGRAFSPDADVASSSLLRTNLRGTAPGTYPEYSAAWCAACHNLRHSNAAPGTLNHPVNGDPAWGYGDVRTTVTNASSMRTENGGAGFAVGMGRTNAAYVMPPVVGTGDGEVTVMADPICQQCHEDARNVEGVFDGDYTSAYVPPYTGVNNPFLTFPHQTTNLKFVVETGDDLCLNCHSVSTLP